MKGGIKACDLGHVRHQGLLMASLTSDTDSFLITDDSGESTLNEVAAQAGLLSAGRETAQASAGSAYFRFKRLSLHVGQFRDRVAMAM